MSESNINMGTMDAFTTAHVIQPSDEKAKEIGFTPDLFDGYLWDNGNEIYMSLIVSLKPGEGNCQRLVKALLEKWDVVKIPLPSDAMVHIAEKFGGKAIIEKDEMSGESFPAMKIEVIK